MGKKCLHNYYSIRFLLFFFFFLRHVLVQMYTVRLQFVVLCPDSLPYLAEWHTLSYCTCAHNENASQRHMQSSVLTFISHRSTVAMAT